MAVVINEVILLAMLMVFIKLTYCEKPQTTSKDLNSASTTDTVNVQGHISPMNSSIPTIFTNAGNKSLVNNPTVISQISPFPLASTPSFNFTYINTSIDAGNNSTLKYFTPSYFNGTRICQSIDVRNKVTNLAQLRGCRVVEGYVQIVLIDHANETDYDSFSLPELREITHYLLFYRVSGLRSIGQLFPSLALIRGNSVFEDYGLVIYEMFHLQEVGLISLTEITRGAIRIEKNPSLCFLNTINWDLIAKWDSIKNYVSNNKILADCPGPAVCQEVGCPLGLCWNSTKCQIQTGNTYKDCDPQCLGGCSGPGPKACHSCRKYLTISGECVTSCPNGTYLHVNRRCVSKDHCLSLIDRQSKLLKNLNFVVFNGTCVQNCPPGYDFTQDRKGCEKCDKGKCRKICPGLSIDNIAASQNLRGCTYINGSLEIAIKHGKHKILAEELEQSLQSVEEIKGYLKIIRCFPLVNLKFFKNLEIIHGYKPLLENGKYSLIVLDNQNLQELWDLTTNRNFKILNGRIFFHYNPKLCFYHIDNLISITDLKNISNYEVAQESNGDKFACNITEVDVKFPVITSNSVLINILLPNRTSRQPSLQRYVLYYTKSASKNMTVFDETDECGDDNWWGRDVLIESSQQVSTIQTFLEPFTQYAFYVKTYTVNSIGGQSPIYYIRTLPSKPSEVIMTLSYSNLSSAIVLQWEPPRQTNGILAEYIITGFLQTDDRELLDQRNYCLYPLIEEPIELLPPDLLTDVENETKSCCPENKITYRPKGEYGRLCDNSGVHHLSIDHDEDLSVTCKKYFYTYIYESPLHPTNCQNQKRGENSKQNSKLKKRDNRAQNWISNKVNVSKLEIKGLRKGINEYISFRERAKSDTTTFIINNLHHFSKYTVSVRACRERYENEKDEYDQRCSKSEIITIRTLSDPKADVIDSEQVTYEVLEDENGAVEIRWVEPQDPNGIVLAFEIEHRRSDLENAKATTECLTHLDYIQNDKKYILRGLPPGKYTFRIRAVSLTGPGAYTKMFAFEIEQISNKIFYKLLFLILIIFIATSSAGGYYYIFRQKHRYMLDLDLLLASINTDHITTPPYVEDSWEVQRENVQILKELGHGSFGKVYEGILHPVRLPCAVKTVTNTSIVNTNAFLNETTMMKRAAGVHHIVQLLGVVSQGGPPLVIMELMSFGDLKTYLRSTRHVPPLGSTFLRMAAQIADAMFFMESNKYVHRDLAARNCMVHKDMTVKVGDFGLTRDVYSTDYYRKGDRGLLPIRWMAPESLRDGMFTNRSDVWSYGVVLWEIATLAEQPYRGLTNEQVLWRVVGGEILTTPAFCPEPLKTVMALCWNRNPAHRPTFRQLIILLEIYTDDVFKCVSYYHTIAMVRDNGNDSEALSQPQIRLIY